VSKEVRTSCQLKNPCRACREQLSKGRHDPPHARLKHVETAKPYRHMFGGGVDTTYECRDRGETIIHSTDRYDAAWR